jgi:hypothetical protein
MTTPTAEDRAKAFDAAQARVRGVGVVPQQSEPPKKLLVFGRDGQPEPAQERQAVPRGISKGEREELRGILNGRRRLAKKVIEQRAAELLADAEEKLAATYKINDAAWKDLTETTEAALRKADEELAQRCCGLGIPEAFRPRMYFSWSGRGENAVAERRTELRRVAVTRISEMSKRAQIQMESKALEGLELLAQSALESAAAQQFRPRCRRSRC